MNKKICLITDSLDSGGAERMVSNLSISLSSKGCQVYIVSMQDNIRYPFSGELFNFGKIKAECNILKSFFKFKTFFKNQDFDVIIDHRVRNNFFKELIFSKVVFNKNRIIYCVHHYNLSFYFPLLNKPWLSKKTLVKNNKIIAVSKDIKAEIKKKLNLNSLVIYNYVLKDELQVDYNVVTDENYIVGVGRLEDVKQFDLLIKSYKKSKLPKNGIKLLILGEGTQKDNLSKLISNLSLSEYVDLVGFKINVSEYLKKAKALVLSSRFEGLPMVLIESLCLKTPIIAFDCKSGPSEIIINNLNGILVKNQDEEQLTASLNRLLDDTFYNNLKKNVHDGLNQFTEKKAVQEWVKLLENQI